ncbi:MAG: ATP-binding protein [Patescibacteria group bacterium]
MKKIERKLFEEIKKHLSSKEISLIIGPRQTGKTTLMTWLKEYLETQDQKTAFFSLDFEPDKQFFVSQSALIAKLELEFGKNKGYVFIDEIQRKENAGIFLKGIYDLNLPYKFIVSGSGSLELKEKIHESLTGRKRIFELNTVTFEEFVNFKTDYRYKDKLVEFFDLDKDQTANFLREYLNFGGYPKVILEDRLSEKIKIIDEIYHSYLEKDISYLLNVAKINEFSSLIKILASQIGNLVNYSELSSTVGISSQTIKNYLWYAEKTFIIRRINPYFRNIRKEITKSPMIYFYDLGLRNYTLGIFGNLYQPHELGFLFENLILNLLREKLRYTGSSIYFWRTKDGAEIDFVIDSKKEILPIEVKYKKLDKKVLIERSMTNFIKEYSPKEAWIVNIGVEKEFFINKTKVKIIPFFKLL